jgi:hypothetical protein
MVRRSSQAVRRVRTAREASALRALRRCGRDSRSSRPLLVYWPRARMGIIFQGLRTVWWSTLDMTSAVNPGVVELALVWGMRNIEKVAGES